MTDRSSLSGSAPIAGGSRGRALALTAQGKRGRALALTAQGKRGLAPRIRRFAAPRRAARSLAPVWFTLALLTAAGAHADANPSSSAFEVPRLQGRVNDYAQLLTSSEREALEQKLRAHETRTGQQFALLTVPSLQGQPIENFGIKVGEAWKLGSAKNDEGLILIIAPHERAMRVEVGYGLEGMIPDAIAARVTREVLAPALQRGAYAEGIGAAFDTLIRAGGGDPAQAQPRSARRTRPSGPIALLTPLLLPLLLFFLFSGGGRGRRRGGFFVGPFIGGGFGGGGGSWGGFGGGGGGGGGDDFRGGGGGFGGGGASGSW